MSPIVRTYVGNVANVFFSRREICMMRKSLLAILLGVTLAGAVTTTYAQEAPKPESPEQEAPAPKPDSPDLRA
jgi:hypothetical protein